MKELKTDELELINGGSWQNVVGVIGEAGSAAIGGIQVGVGMATAAAGALTLDPIGVAAGGALMSDGIYNISNVF